MFLDVQGFQIQHKNEAWTKLTIAIWSQILGRAACFVHRVLQRCWTNSCFWYYTPAFAQTTVEILRLSCATSLCRPLGH